MQTSNSLLKYRPESTICADRFFTEKICVNRRTEKPVLIRRYHKKHMINHSLTTNLELQIKLMNKFEYRHWLRPIEYLQNANYAYEIFSTGLDTLSLESLLSVELSDKEIRYLTAQLVCAIDSLHREGYYHSNIHPKAFVLCDDGILRMTNMFYAKKIENGKKKEKIEGGLPLDKHIFMAPQLFDPNTKENLTMDFWGLGIILYHFYHDRQPFCMSELSGQCKVWSLIEYNEAKIPRDALDLMKKLLRRSQDRIGRQCISEIKRHPFFSGVDWAFSNAAEVLPHFEMNVNDVSKGVVWREMYFYDLDVPMTRDNVYFHGFTFLPAPNNTIVIEKREAPWKMPTEWRPNNQFLQGIWDKIEKKVQIQEREVQTKGKLRKIL